MATNVAVVVVAAAAVVAVAELNAEDKSSLKLKTGFCIELKMAHLTRERGRDKTKKVQRLVIFKYSMMLVLALVQTKLHS